MRIHPSDAGVGMPMDRRSEEMSRIRDAKSRTVTAVDATDMPMRSGPDDGGQSRASIPRCNATRRCSTPRRGADDQDGRRLAGHRPYQADDLGTVKRRSIAARSQVRGTNSMRQPAHQARTDTLAGHGDVDRRRRSRIEVTRRRDSTDELGERERGDLSLAALAAERSGDRRRPQLEDAARQSGRARQLRRSCTPRRDDRAVTERDSERRLPRLARRRRRRIHRAVR